MFKRIGFISASMVALGLLVGPASAFPPFRPHMAPHMSAPPMRSNFGFPRSNFGFPTFNSVVPARGFGAVSFAGPNFNAGLNHLAPSTPRFSTSPFISPFNATSFGSFSPFTRSFSPLGGGTIPASAFNNSISFAGPNFNPNRNHLAPSTPRFQTSPFGATGFTSPFNTTNFATTSFNPFTRTFTQSTFNPFTRNFAQTAVNPFTRSFATTGFNSAFPIVSTSSFNGLTRNELTTQFNPLTQSFAGAAFNPFTRAFATTAFNPATQVFGTTVLNPGRSLVTTQFNPFLGNFVTTARNPLTGTPFAAALGVSSLTAPQAFAFERSVGHFDRRLDRIEDRYRNALYGNGYGYNAYASYGAGYNPYPSSAGYGGGYSPMMYGGGVGAYSPIYGSGYGQYGSGYSNPYSTASYGGSTSYGNAYANQSSGGNATAQNSGAAATAQNPFTAFGIPNDNGALQWPLAIRLMPPDQKKDLADKAEGLLKIATSQAVSGKANPAVVREAIRSVAQMHEWLKTRRPNLAERTYTDGEVFLLNLDRVLDGLAS